MCTGFPSTLRISRILKAFIHHKKSPKIREEYGRMKEEIKKEKKLEYTVPKIKPFDKFKPSIGACEAGSAASGCTPAGALDG
jgi:hypothetical protein